MNYQPFRVIIAGSRKYEDYQILSNIVEFCLKRKENVVILSGGARGADRLGERYARENGLPLEKWPANWRYGKHAGKLRNAQMAEAAHALIAFWDGHSPGTKHMIETAKEKGLAVRVINI